MGMPRSKIEAFYLEFPWLKFFVKKNLELQIRVCRIDVEIFKKERRRAFDGVFVESIHALDRDGDSLGQVGYTPVVNQSWLARLFGGYLMDDEIRLETLEGLFDRLGNKASRVKYVLLIDWPLATVEIYKAPRDVSVREYIETEIKRAREEVKAQLVEVDKV